MEKTNDLQIDDDDTAKNNKFNAPPARVRNVVSAFNSVTETAVNLENPVAKKAYQKITKTIIMFPMLTLILSVYEQNTTKNFPALKEELKKTKRRFSTI